MNRGEIRAASFAATDALSVVYRSQVAALDAPMRELIPVLGPGVEIEVWRTEWGRPALTVQFNAVTECVADTLAAVYGRGF